MTFLDAVTHPAFADAPQLGPRFSARALGVVIAVYEGFSLLLLLLFMLPGNELGSSQTGTLRGLTGGLVAVLGCIGGYRMFRGEAVGKRLVVYTLGLGLVLGFAVGVVASSAAGDHDPASLVLGNLSLGVPWFPWSCTTWSS